MSATVTIRDLRTRFPHLKALLERDGEVIVTDRGRRAFVLRRYLPPPDEAPPAVDYLERLLRRMPRPMTAAAARALDAANRDDR
jgi:antitoxin (DNA-binding transcriptional repressor) of toxin-antitoxin stability system